MKEEFIYNVKSKHILQIKKRQNGEVKQLSMKKKFFKGHDFKYDFKKLQQSKIIGIHSDEFTSLYFSIKFVHSDHKDRYVFVNVIESIPNPLV